MDKNRVLLGIADTRALPGSRSPVLPTHRTRARCHAAGLSWCVDVGFAIPWQPSLEPAVGSHR